MDGISEDIVLGRVVGESITNTSRASCKNCAVTCEDQWSVTQLQTVNLLCEGHKLVEDSIRRSKRTAGNYAKLYLSDEGTEREGRFYWPGLAAFAAKDVVNGIAFADEKMGSFVAQARAMAGVSLYYLLKGNLWVFVEVTTWALFYKTYGAELFEHCVDRRDVATYDSVAKTLMRNMPWALGENVDLKKSIEKRLKAFDVVNWQWSTLRLGDAVGALTEVKNCKATKPLKTGFSLLKAYEQTSDAQQRGKYAYDSATEFLIHEQTLHLQKLVYDHEAFQFAMKNNDLGRYWWHFMGARDPSLIFNAQASITRDIEASKLEPLGLSKDSVEVTMALDDGKLYNSADRMRYVKRILDQYHMLMQNPRFKPYMVRQLTTIAGWANA